MNEFFLRILWLPPQASTMAPVIDHLHFWVISVTMIASAACGLTAFYFYVRFRRRSEGERTVAVPSPWWFEPAVVCIPLGIFLAWWAIGYRDYVRLFTPPPNAMDVYVTGKQWMWKFSYPGGPNSVDTLHVPAHRPVRLLMTSRDVIHSFYVPDFRIKHDVLPGRVTQLWFEAVRPGTFQILCAELCGVSHSSMWGEVVAHEPAEFDTWLEEQKRGLVARRDVGQTADEPVLAGLPEEGRRIAAESGCLKCHSVDGSTHIGPTFLDMYEREEQLSDGRTVIADEEYLTESIMDPLAKIVAGYVSVMPTYQGKLSAPEVGALLEYLRTLHSPGPSLVQTRPPVYLPAPGAVNREEARGLVVLPPGAPSPMTEQPVRGTEIEGEPAGLQQRIENQHLPEPGGLRPIRSGPAGAQGPAAPPR